MTMLGPPWYARRVPTRPNISMTRRRKVKSGDMLGHALRAEWFLAFSLATTAVFALTGETM
jgi:hypothetical protein